MATNVETTDRARPRTATIRRRRLGAILTPAESIAVGWGAGLLGGIVMALPLILWDWVHMKHVALELPMATTAWLFGLNHFSHDTYLIGSIVLGFVFLCLYWVASGLAFTGIADRVLGVTTLGKSLVAGAAWSFVSFVFFWDMLLPLARDGAPFRKTGMAPALFVAPEWVWIVAFAAFGIATGAFYAMLRRPAPTVVDVEYVD